MSLICIRQSYTRRGPGYVLKHEVFKLYQNTEFGHLTKHNTNFLLKLGSNQHHSVRKNPMTNKIGKCQLLTY